MWYLRKRVRQTAAATLRGKIDIWASKGYVVDGIKWWAVVNAVMNFRVAQNEGNFMSNWGAVRFSRRNLPFVINKDAVCLHTN
jgi:hypothetical protein